MCVGEWVRRGEGLEEAKEKCVCVQVKVGDDIVTQVEYSLQLTDGYIVGEVRDGG